MPELLEVRSEGIYCSQGGFFIDPWKPVAKAIITHAHSDHARPGMQHYLAHHDTVPILRLRLGEHISVAGADYNKTIDINGVKVSFHPAGHIIGSAQIRVEFKGEVWVVSGDYKTTDDGYCVPFESVACHTFITESTFGLPIFSWKPQDELFESMNTWWRQNSADGKTSMILCYSLGKAQRVLHGLDENIGKIYTHGSVENTNHCLRNNGHSIKDTIKVDYYTQKKDMEGGIVLAPPGAVATPWMKRFSNVTTATVSGWMAMRGTRRRQNTDFGIPLSDHADWSGLLDAVKASGATKVLVTHGYASSFAQYLRELGLDSRPLITEFGEVEAADAASDEASEKI